jgi:hypothetical protein
VLIIGLPLLPCGLPRRRAGAADQVNVPLRRRDSAGRFFLESVQNVQDALQTRCVDGAVGITIEVVANLQNPAETLQGLRVARVFAELRFEKGLADLASDGCGKCP